MSVLLVRFFSVELPCESHEDGRSVVRKMAKFSCFKQRIKEGIGRMNEEEVKVIVMICRRSVAFHTIELQERTT